MSNNTRYVRASSGLNLRTDGDLNAGVIRTITQGSPVNWTGGESYRHGRRWVEVNHNGTTGWVDSQHLSVDRPMGATRQAPRLDVGSFRDAEAAMERVSQPMPTQRITQPANNTPTMSEVTMQTTPMQFERRPQLAARGSGLTPQQRFERWLLTMPQPERTDTILRFRGAQNERQAAENAEAWNNMVMQSLTPNGRHVMNHWQNLGISDINQALLVVNVLENNRRRNVEYYAGLRTLQAAGLSRNGAALVELTFRTGRPLGQLELTNQSIEGAQRFAGFNQTLKPALPNVPNWINMTQDIQKIINEYNK